MLYQKQRTSSKISTELKKKKYNQIQIKCKKNI